MNISERDPPARIEFEEVLLRSEALRVSGPTE